MNINKPCAGRVSTGTEATPLACVARAPGKPRTRSWARRRRSIRRPLVPPRTSTPVQKSHPMGSSTPSGPWSGYRGSSATSARTMPSSSQGAAAVERVEAPPGEPGARQLACTLRGLGPHQRRPLVGARLPHLRVRIDGQQPPDPHRHLQARAPVMARGSKSMQAERSGGSGSRRRDGHRHQGPQRGAGARLGLGVGQPRSPVGRCD
jgi:hypothetical protein